MTNSGPIHPPTAQLLWMGSKALGTAVVPKIAEPNADENVYTFLYFFPDGGVGKLVDDKPDRILFEQAYMVMVSIPSTGNAAPYVEIIKSDFGSASLILTANVPSPDSPRDNGKV